MTGRKIELSEFLSAIEGNWEGSEKIVMGPGPEEQLVASGTFSNRPALAGRGFVSSYSQTVGGAPALDCQTTYVFDDNDKVQMAWVPSSGEAQLFRGERHGHTIEVAREDENRMTHTILADYGTAGVATISSTIKSADAPAIEVFSARYARTSER